MKHLFTLIVCLASACTTFAGQYYLVSMTETSFLASGNSAFFHGARGISGHTISTTLTMRDSISFNVQGQLEVVVSVKVRWVEDYPGEPAPSSVDAVWDFWVEGKAGLTRGVLGDSCYTYCTFAPPVFPTSPSYMGTSTPGILQSTGGPQTNTTVGSGLTFSNVGGQWIGTGSISLIIQAGGSGSGSSRMTFASMNAFDATLVRTLAGDPIQ